MPDPPTIRGRAEASAAILNAALVVFVPLALIVFEHNRLGATTSPIMLMRSALVLLPFAALAAWRTWVHANGWRARKATVWQPVAEAAATGFVVALGYGARGILTRPADAPAYVIAYGGIALILGAIVGLILRTTAVLTLRLYGWILADDSEESQRRTTP